MSQKSFSALKERVKNLEYYWIADAKHTFTEELFKLARVKGVSKSELARRLGKSPAYITKVFRGDTNFTLATMIRLVRALGGRLHIHVASDVHDVVAWWYRPEKTQQLTTPENWRSENWISVLSRTEDCINERTTPHS